MTLRNEIENTVHFFAETDMKLYGKVTDETKHVAEVQKVKLNTELVALQNAATTAGLIVHENFSADKRKTVKKYFLQSGNATVSPVLNYDQMNHFLLGWLRALRNS